MDAVNVDIDPSAESFQHTSLRSLDVCNLPIGDPETVARIIFSALPCIDGIGYGNSELNAWRKVDRLLHEFTVHGRRNARAAPTNFSPYSFVRE